MSKDKERYPIAPNLLQFWNRGSRKGKIEIQLGPAHSLSVRYEHYTPPSYFLGDHFLGTFLLDGEPLHVTENYGYHTITNSRTTRWSGSSSSESGIAACSELIMAHEQGRAIQAVQTSDEEWEITAAAEVDQSFHEVDIEYYGFKATLDLKKLTLILNRSYFRDAST